MRHRQQLVDPKVVSVEMFRFKLRTLLIATALIGLFLGLHVHVHNKARRFVEEMSEYQSQPVPSVELDSPTWVDYVKFERRIIVFYRSDYVRRGPYIDRHYTLTLGYRGHAFNLTTIPGFCYRLTPSSTAMKFS